MKVGSLVRAPLFPRFGVKLDRDTLLIQGVQIGANFKQLLLEDGGAFRVVDHYFLRKSGGGLTSIQKSLTAQSAMMRPCAVCVMARCTSKQTCKGSGPTVTGGCWPTPDEV